MVQISVSQSAPYYRLIQTGNV